MDDYTPDPFTREEMLKKLDLEKFQIEDGSGEEESNVKKKEDAESVCSKSEDEDESQEHVEHGSEISSAPQSPSGSVDAGRSEDEVHISENEDSNQGSDNEEGKNEKESEGSDDETNKGEKTTHDSEHEDSVPEISIQSEDEENEHEGNEEKAESDNEGNTVIKNSVEHEDESEIEKHENKQPSDIEEAHGKGSPHPAVFDNEEGNETQVDTEGKSEDVLKTECDAEGNDPTKPGYGDLIANIFGDSDEEGFEGFNEDDVVTVRKRKECMVKRSNVISDSEDEGGKSGTEAMDHEPEKREDEQESETEADKDVAVEDEQSAEKSASASNKKGQPAVSDDDSDDGIKQDFVSDFDLMMQKKKDESSRRRKRKDVDIINDSDDLIADIIAQMRQAADEDRLLNKNKKTATKKLKILPLVMSQLKKQDLKMAFLDQGVLNVMADWLAPLPDRSLPNLQIREGMIKQLDEFPSIDQSLLKSSGVGRALMYLFKHPKETKENKERAGRLITEWARPIFNVTTNYHSLTKEEREQRDYDHIPKKRKVRDRSEATDDSPEKKDIDKALSENDKKLRPGDKGWIGRARVPAPSTKDYVFRPKWNVEMECGRGPSRKSSNRFEKHMRSIQEKKRISKCQRAVTISIEGRKMAI